MPDYQKSFIYRLQCLDKDVGEIYIGSSCNFNSRKGVHKYDCNKVDGKRYNHPVYQFIRENGGWDNWEMIKICDFPCSTKKELIVEEGRYIRELGLDNCLNSVIPGRTIKEWEQDKKVERAETWKKYRQANKEILAEKSKKYREKNKEQIDKYEASRSVKITCVCGSVIQKRAKARHELSQKHQKFLEQNPESE